MSKQKIIEIINRNPFSTKYDIDYEDEFSYKIYPKDFDTQTDTPTFKIVIERTAFKYNSRIELSNFAGRVVEKLSNIYNDQSFKNEFQNKLNEVDWKDDFNIAESLFRISDTKLFPDEGEEHLLRSVKASQILMEFALGAYQTKKNILGKKSKIRILNDKEDSSPWEYDPSEKDKSTNEHKKLENWMIRKLEKKGIESKDPNDNNIQYDLGWEEDNKIWICEAKSTINNETEQLRLGIGQILHYLYSSKKYNNEKETNGVLLVSKKPSEEVWNQICEENSICLIWPPENYDK